MKITESTTMISYSGQIIVNCLFGASVSFALLVLFTSLLNLLALGEWTNLIIWPPMLYLGGIIGGVLGGSITSYQIMKVSKENNRLKPRELVAPELIYVGAIIALVYLMEGLSEGVVVQVLLFSLEILWFTILCRNLTTIMYEPWNQQ